MYVCSSVLFLVNWINDWCFLFMIMKNFQKEILYLFWKLKRFKYSLKKFNIRWDTSFIESYSSDWTLKIKVIWEIRKYIKFQRIKYQRKDCIRYLNLSLIAKKDVFIRVFSITRRFQLIIRTIVDKMGHSKTTRIRLFTFFLNEIKTYDILKRGTEWSNT